MPDEGLFSLSLLDGKGTLLDGKGTLLDGKGIWRSDALRDPRIEALVRELTVVIEQVTGFRPVVLR